MRNLLILVVGLAAGLAAGALITAQTYAQRLQAMEEARDNARAEAAALTREVGDLEATASATTAQLRALEDRMARLDARAQAPAPAPMPEQDWADAFAADAAPMDAPAPGQPATPAPDDAEPAGDAQNPEQAEREARRAEFRQRFQERVDTFFEEQYARARTAEEQERIALMQEYSQYAMDLRQSMRDAETDAERETLAEQFRDTWTALRDLRDEQQASMLREVASDFGITGADQQAFADAMLQLQESPFFNPGAAMRGGPGGFGGRGPR
jgi:hypothetical protein